MELQQVAQYAIKAPGFQWSSAVFCEHPQEVAAHRKQKKLSALFKKKKKGLVGESALLLTSPLGQLVPLTLSEDVGKDSFRATPEQHRDPAKLYTTAAGTAFSQKGDVCVHSSTGSSHDLLVTDLSSGSTFTVEFNLNTASSAKSNEQRVLRQLTSGLTIQSTSIKWKWQTLFVSNDATAILGQGLGPDASPSLWLWTRSGSNPKAGAKAAGAWQLLPRMPHVRSSADALAEPGGPPSATTVQLHARFLMDRSVRGEVLLAIAAIGSSPSTEGKTELSTLQLPVHTGASGLVQGASFLETWHCCHIDGLAREGSSGRATARDSGPAFGMAWDDTGTWLALTSSGINSSHSQIHMFSADLGSSRQVAWNAVPSGCIYGMATFCTKGSSVPLVVLSDGAHASLWQAFLPNSLRDAIAAAQQSELAEKMSLSVPEVSRLATAEPAAQGSKTLSSMTQEELDKAAALLDSGASSPRASNSSSALSLMAEEPEVEDADEVAPGTSAPVPAIVAAAPAPGIQAASAAGDPPKQAASVPANASATTSRELELLAVDIAPAGAPDSWLHRLGDLCQRYELDAAVDHLLCCICTARQTQERAQAKAAQGLCRWMGSLMEQHLLARHLAAKAGMAAGMDDISMPSPAFVQGKGTGKAGVLWLSAAKLEAALQQHRLWDWWTPAAAAGLLMYAEGDDKAVDTGFRVWRSLMEHQKAALLAGAGYVLCNSGPSPTDVSQAQSVAEMTLAPAASLPLAEQADFVVGVCTVFERAAGLGPVGSQGSKALQLAAAVQGCTLLLGSIAGVLRALPLLPPTAHQAEASLTQQALMLLGKAMRSGMEQFATHSSIAKEALAATPHARRLFGMIWELPGGRQRIASLHKGFTESKINLHGSSTEEFIDKLAAEKAISEQDSVWLIYGASSADVDDPKAELLAQEIEDLNQQIFLHHTTKAIMHLLRPMLSSQEATGHSHFRALLPESGTNLASVHSAPGLPASWETFVSLTQDQLVAWASDSVEPVSREQGPTQAGHQAESHIPNVTADSIDASMSATLAAVTSPNCWQHPFLLGSTRPQTARDAMYALRSMLGQHSLPAVAAWEKASLQQLHCQQAEARQRLPPSTLALEDPASSRTPDFLQQQQQQQQRGLHSAPSAFNTAKLREAAAAALNRNMQGASTKQQMDQAMMDAKAAARALRVRVQRQGSVGSSLGEAPDLGGVAALGLAPHLASRLSTAAPPPAQNGSPQTIAAAYASDTRPSAVSSSSITRATTIAAMPQASADAQAKRPLGMSIDPEMLVGYRPLETGLGIMTQLQMPRDVPHDFWKLLTTHSKAGVTLSPPKTAPAGNDRHDGSLSRRSSQSRAGTSPLRMLSRQVHGGNEGSQHARLQHHRQHGSAGMDAAMDVSEGSAGLQRSSSQPVSQPERYNAAAVEALLKRHQQGRHNETSGRTVDRASQSVKRATQAPNAANAAGAKDAADSTLHGRILERVQEIVSELVQPAKVGARTPGKPTVPADGPVDVKHDPSVQVERLGPASR
ncbi:hypothetical protein WJX73_010587 [Symbiochloris irregularis]|uniref:Uncharacterized protein n=1 Tax=Symbiochloris irregularis TaxID=706552 RepID=A0AAW1P3L2_9CHLO